MGSTALTNTLRVLIDIIMLILAAMPSMVFKFGNIKPTQRGFFCDDPSISYPYYEGTVSTTALILVGGFTNLVVIVVCEVIHFLVRRRENNEIAAERFLFKINVNPCLYMVCGYIWTLGFGMMVTQGITDIGKWSVGRLRPHFLDGCRPEGINITTCTTRLYIENVVCTRMDQKILDDLRLSFPSGHASQSAFTMIYIACYIQQRIPRFNHSYLFKHVLQFIVICMAWFCSLSRVMDNKHHPTDVLGGFTIGTVVALLCAKYVVKGFRDPYKNGPFHRSGVKGSMTLANSSDAEGGNSSGVEPQLMGSISKSSQ